MHAHNLSLILTYSFLHHTRFIVGTKSNQTFFEADTHQCVMPGFPMCVFHKNPLLLVQMHDCFFFPFSGKIFCHHSLIHFFSLQPEITSKVSLSHSMLPFHFEIGGIDTLLFSLAPLKVNITLPALHPLSSNHNKYINIFLSFLAPHTEINRNDDDKFTAMINRR